MNGKKNRDGVLILDWQVRAARAALGLSTRKFCELCSISLDTLARCERGEKLKLSTQARIVAAIEQAGFVIEAAANAPAAIRAKSSRSRR
ncbi:hypothetical protein ACOSOMT5_P0688 [Acidiphilium sp. MT5]